jgi:nitrogen fixation NifU-like protein
MINDLEDLYREIILDHYKNPRNQGELVVPPAVVQEGYNPLCGDEIKVYVEVDGERLTAVTTTGQGCSISRSSASLLTQAVKGHTLAEVNDMIHQFRQMMGVDAGTDLLPPTDRELGELAALKGVVKFPVRIKCALLSWNTFEAALAKATSR